MESINGLYKAECIRTTVFHDGPYKTLADVEYATAGWVDWYNNRQAPLDPGQCPPRRVRASPLRCPQPRAAPRIGTAENLGRFKIHPTDNLIEIDFTRHWLNGLVAPGSGGVGGEPELRVHPGTEGHGGWAIV